jgi:DNA adenine methylase
MLRSNDAPPSARRLGPGDAAHEETARPFLKWAGGKWALAAKIASLLPVDLASRTYREPFLGGGAMFFFLHANRRPSEAHLSDALADLVQAYSVVRDNAPRLVRALERLRAAHGEAHYYQVREAFNRLDEGTALQRASWLIYLNKTCYNGLYRTNRAGHFNVPVGRFVNPRVVDRPKMEAASVALRGASLRCASYEHLLESAAPGDAIYLDPPYVPLSRTANFSSYSTNFGPAEQRRLADVYRELDRRGCLLALSNSDTPEVRKLYAGFDLHPIVAPRSIGARGTARGTVTELLVRNLARWPRSARPKRGRTSGAP